jgi:hypothetical protein
MTTLSIKVLRLVALTPTLSQRERGWIAYRRLRVALALAHFLGQRG